MEMQQENLLASISQEKLLGLTTKVEETFATDFIKKGQRVFSATDLWNIQRQQKARCQRRDC